MSKSQHKSGGAPLPENYLTDKRISVCLCIPNEPEYRQAFIGHLADMGKWWFWEKGGLGDRRATEAAELWRRLLATEMHMPCLGSNRIAKQYFNQAGHWEVEYEDGTTEVRDDLDPRYSSPTFYPLPGADGSDKRCAAAGSIRTILEEDFIQAMDDADTSNALLTLVIAMIAVFLTAGAGLPLLVMAMVNAIIGFGIAATKSAFTAQVWDDLECILYCNMGDDASFTEGQWQTVKDLVFEHYAGSIVQTVLYNTINAAGFVGLTNMARSGRVTDNDCSLCDCDDTWCYLFDFVTAGDEDWTPDSHLDFGMGVYVLGEGWNYTDKVMTSQNPDQARRAVQIERIFSTRTITRIVATYNYVKGSTSSGTAPASLILVGDTTLVSRSFNAETDGVGKTLEWNGAVSASNIRFISRSSLDIAAPYTYSGDVRLTSVLVEGLGTNPFGEDNCPEE